MSSLSGATFAASAIASAFSADNFPFRIAAAVFGSFRTRRGLDALLRRNRRPRDRRELLGRRPVPGRRHVLPSSTRRASNVFADAATRSILLNAFHAASTSDSGTASGSRSPTSPRNRGSGVELSREHDLHVIDGVRQLKPKTPMKSGYILCSLSPWSNSTRASASISVSPRPRVLGADHRTRQAHVGATCSTACTQIVIVGSVQAVDPPVDRPLQLGDFDRVDTTEAPDSLRRVDARQARPSTRSTSSNALHVGRRRRRCSTSGPGPGSSCRDGRRGGLAVGVDLSATMTGGLRIAARPRGPWPAPTRSACRSPTPHFDVCGRARC